MLRHSLIAVARPVIPQWWCEVILRWWCDAILQRWWRHKIYSGDGVVRSYSDGGAVRFAVVVERLDLLQRWADEIYYRGGKIETKDRVGEEEKERHSCVPLY